MSLRTHSLAVLQTMPPRVDAHVLTDVTQDAFLANLLSLQNMSVLG